MIHYHAKVAKTQPYKFTGHFWLKKCYPPPPPPLTVKKCGHYLPPISHSKYMINPPYTDVWANSLVQRGAHFSSLKFWVFKGIFDIFYHIYLTIYIIWDWTKVLGSLPPKLAEWQPSWFSANFYEPKLWDFRFVRW